MRRRRKKGSDIKLMSYTDYAIRDGIENLKGKWSEKFGNENPIYVEFGTGKGQFITTLAKQNPDINYIAVEKKEEVLLKAVEKAVENESKNIVFLWTDVSDILEYFDRGEISRIYINFCDPWPKKRWAKRRLLHRSFLEKYATILKEKGEVHFKTDNVGLFEFALNEVSDCDWKLKNISLDLANNDEFENVTTEYEDKFMSQNIKIHRLEAVKPL